MDKFVVTSMRQSAGKTSVIIGIAKALNKKIGYIKPFGERFLYRKKRLWDYDAALITNIFGLEENPEDMSIGFNHAKLLSMLNENDTRDKLQELLINVGTGKELFFAECGKDITYGSAVHLDAISLARQFDARLLVVTSGSEDMILDDLVFLKKYIGIDPVRLAGVIINKVENIAEFSETCLPQILRHGIRILGIIPYYRELPCCSAGYLVDRLFAKIITGEESLNRTIRTIFIGSMSVEAALKDPRFGEGDKVVIASGDRGDLIDAALESKTAAVIVTNNILPSADLTAKAGRMDIPLLLVPADTFETARQIEGLEPLPTKDDTEKIALIEQMVRTHVDIEALLR